MLPATKLTPSTLTAEPPISGPDDLAYARSLAVPSAAPSTIAGNHGAPTCSYVGCTTPLPAYSRLGSIHVASVDAERNAVVWPVASTTFTPASWLKR